VPPETENIVLPYRVGIYTDRILQTILFAQSCEFFTDEHGKQWVKFVATNGHMAGQEHMLRTEQIIIVRDDRGPEAQTS
jgi:hypothetical protein